MASCGESYALTREQAEGIESYATAARAGDDAVLVAAVDGGEMIVACVRTGGRWTTCWIAENGGVESLYRSDRGDIFAWAYEGRGDPPFAFSALHLPATEADRFCTSIGVPGDLNQPDWQGEAFSFDRFNVADDGTGAIVGSSDVERDGRAETWTFRYATTDGGRSWGEPERVEGGCGVTGVYVRVEEQDERLLEELRNSVA